MERALLNGEVAVQQEKIIQDEKFLDQLNIKDLMLADELEAFKLEEGVKITDTKQKMENIEAELDK